MQDITKIKVIVGLQVLSLVSAVIDGHTKFFNGYFGVLAWGAFGVGIIIAGMYLIEEFN